jgi:hypothetical protein
MRDVNVVTSWYSTAVSALGGHNLTLAILAALSNLLIAVSLVKPLRQRKILSLLLTVVVSVVASVFSFHYLANPSAHDSTSIVIVFGTSMLLWTVTFHILAFNLGATIIAANLGRWSALSRAWPKTIDYAYYTISALSALKLVSSLVTANPGLTHFNALATVFLGLAIGLKLTRTSAEIFHWDRDRDAHY